ncbi:3-oxoacyl-[acyl-carrier-protein] synthase 3 [Campylobacterota bacterium]|nr:3-oxoacyl-[acyl-carrier-protein] synthase 3 [Campylobacterota bacterium]
MKKTFASMLSIGSYAPERRLTNADLEKLVDTSDEWIVKRTGIKERRIAREDEAASDVGLIAAKQALDRAGLSAQDMDMVIVATLSGDFLFMPSTAAVLAGKLGMKNIPAFDVLAACSGFIYALSVARAYVESGLAKNILIVGAEVSSRFMDYSDRSVCILFGDGAGAAVISATDDADKAIVDVKISADGSLWDFLTIEGGSKNPICAAERGMKPFMRMKGNETFKLAVRTLASDVVEILARNSLKAEQIDHFVPHQANLRIIQAVGDSLGFTESQVVLTVDRFGNTSAASIPMAINDIYEKGLLKSGDLMLLDAFGGGLTWGSALVRFGGK